MPLEKKQLGFPFVKGINTIASDKSQVVGELVDCDNLRMAKTGRLDKRLGFERLPNTIPEIGDTSAGTVGGARALARLGDEILLMDGERAYSKSTDDKWVDRGKMLDIRSECGFVGKDMQATSGNVSYAISGNYEYLAWAQQPFDTTGQGALTGRGSFPEYKYLVRDRHTGATIIPATTVDVAETYYLHGYVVSVTNGANTVLSAGGNWEEHIFAIGDFVEIGGEKRVVTAVTSTGLSVSGNWGIATGTTYTMRVWKDTGPHALYVAPRLRLLAPVGSPHVYLLVQTQRSIISYYADTGSGTHADLEFGGESVLTTLARPFPVWDADWMLCSDSAVTDTTDALIVVGRSKESTYSGSVVTEWDLVSYNINSSSGALTEYKTSDYPRYGSFSGGGRYTFDPVARTNYQGSAITDGATFAEQMPIWQPVVKVLHYEVNGVPAASSNTFVFTAVSISGLTGGSGSATPHTRGFLLSRTLTDLWDTQLYTEAETGVPEGWAMTRAGVLHDSPSTSGGNIHVMLEMRHSQGGNTPFLFNSEEASQIVYGSFARSDGARDTATSKGLWTGVSVHSDGFVPSGGDGRYFWFSAAPSLNSLNSITFLADQDGHIHAHGVQGRAAICASLEHPQMRGNYSTFHRNMGCAVTRVTPERWHTSGSNEFRCGSSMADLGAKFQDFNFIQPALLKWDCSPNRPFRHQEANGVLYIGGGTLWSYDGNRIIENEHLLYPEFGVGGFETSAPSGLPSGEYSYYVTFEYRDDAGVNHVSRPAGPHVVEDTLAGFTVIVNQLTNHRFSGKSGNPPTYKVNIYRSNADGTVHYLHDSIDADAWGDDFGVDAGGGNYGHGRVAYADNDITQHDAKTERLLWDFIPASLAGAPLPSPVDVTRHKDSIMVANTDNAVYGSIGLSPTEAAIFPPFIAENAGSFGFFGDSRETPVSHVASNGATFLFFTKDSAYAVGGEGPDQNGEGGWTRPVKFASGQGVRPDGFIAETPLGVIYSSQRGIYQVTPELQVSNIGAPVDDYRADAVANAPLIIDSTSEVIVPLAGNAPTALVYNYFFGQWYRISTSSTFQPGRHVEWLGWIDKTGTPVVYYVDASGYLYRQKTESSDDPYKDTIKGGSDFAVDASVATSWMQFPAFGGKMRCYRVLLMGTPDGTTSAQALSCTVSSNFDDSPVDETFAKSIDSTGIGKSDKSGSSQVVMKPAQQKVEAMKVAFTLTGVSERGWSPEGLILEVAQRPPATRFKQDQTKSVDAT